MPQGISPNPLNKLSEIYLSHISEHHKKDVDGNTIPHEGEDVDEAMYTGPNKGDRKLIKKMDDPSYAKKLADYEKNMDPKKRQELKDKATKGMKFTHEGTSYGLYKGSGKPSGVMKDFLDKKAKKLEKERASQSQAARNNPAFDSTSPNSKDPAVARSRAEEVQLEAKYEAGASTYGKATIRNKRKFGTSGELPDPLTGKKITKDATRGELITKRKEEHKAKRGVKTKVKMESLSDWREDFIWENEVEGPDTKDQKKVVEKNIKNKIIINPKLGEAVEELGGQLIDVQEMNGSEDKKEMDPQMKSKMLRQRQLKKQVLLRKLQAVRQTGGEDIVASYEPEGEQLDEYGDPKVGMRLRVARAIDSVNPKPKMGSKRTAISNKLKMASIKAETRRRQQKENPYSAGKRMKMVATSIGDRVKQKAKAMTTREDYIPEEEYDHYKDRMAERGIDISSPDKKDATTMPRKPEKPSKGMTAAQKAAKGRSALDIVKADIRKKYGKDAIMDLGKK